MSNAIKIISICTGIFVGVLMTVQFRTSSPVSSSYPLDQLEAQKELIKEYVDEEAVLKSRVSILRGKIDTALKNNEALIKTSNLETLNRLKEEMGLTEKSGEGFTIELNDSSFIDRENLKNEEPGIVYAADIRDLVNLLRSHRVEGIAINGQRVIATTTITSVGNTVMVNNSHLAPPFTLSAIGDYNSLILRLQDPATLTDLQKRIKENGIQFAVKKSPYVVLPLYNGLFHTNYIQAKSDETI
jgi:uncharacterized protein YlxW (UPF0749 family)